MARDTSAYRQVLVESFIPPNSTGRRAPVQIRPVQGQAYSSTLAVQCASRLTDTRRFPVGTKFLLLAKMTDRLGGTPFLYAYHGDPDVVVTNQQAKAFINEFKRGRI